MLLELIVENYAVVEHAHIRFQPGFNVLTGETGSGKSIVVDSLGLLLGLRASSDAIRTGAAKARVSGVFSAECGGDIEAVLASANIDREGDDLIVEREIAAGGKSRAYVSNRPVTTALLRQLAPSLGDIHGQNEQQQLAAPERQRDLLDGYAAIGPLRARVAAAFAKWRAIHTKLNELTADEQQRLRLLDLWTFQRKEIDAVSPKPGEDETLEAERKVLQNVTRLQESASSSFAALYDSPESATAQLRIATKRLDEVTRIDATLAETVAAMKQAAVLLDEAAYALRDYVGELEADPKRLEDVESRLAALDRLKRKYGGTLEAVLAFRQDVAVRADEVENAAAYRAALENDLSAAAADYEGVASTLSRERADAAYKLARAVEEELKSLAMNRTRFVIELRQAAWAAHGADEIQFLVSPNSGEDPKPLDRVASGGELSRIALALKTAAQNGTTEGPMQTLVFDEVDAGIGGAAAAAVGKRLKILSQSNQVICVTHLAQIAGFADHQYAVSKAEKSGRVATEITELDRAGRAHEIGRMLSGDRVTPEALKQAEQLMRAGARH